MSVHGVGAGVGTKVRGSNVVVSSGVGAGVGSSVGARDGSSVGFGVGAGVGSGAVVQWTEPDTAVGLPAFTNEPPAPVLMWQPPFGKLLKNMQPTVLRHRCRHCAGVPTVRPCPAMSKGK